jgi:hypothetical protein
MAESRFCTSGEIEGASHWCASNFAVRCAATTRGVDRLIEPHHHDKRGVRPASTPIRFGSQQLRRRRRKAEAVRLAQGPAADRGRRRVHRNVVASGIRQRALGVRRKDEDGRARPAEGAGDGRCDPNIRGPDDSGNTTKRDHRLREDDPNFVGFGQAGHFAGRAGAHDRQVPAAAGSCLRRRPNWNEHTEAHAEREKVLHTASCRGEGRMANANGVRARIKTRRKEPELSRHTPGRVAVAG